MAMATWDQICENREVHIVKVVQEVIDSMRGAITLGKAIARELHMQIISNAEILVARMAASAVMSQAHEQVAAVVAAAANLESSIRLLEYAVAVHQSTAEYCLAQLKYCNNLASGAPILIVRTVLDKSRATVAIARRIIPMGRALIRASKTQTMPPGLLGA